MTKDRNKSSIEIAYAWCLAWGSELQPQVDVKVLHQMRQAILNGDEVPEPARSYVQQAQELNKLPYPQTLNELKALSDNHPKLWNSRIGLVYGGATKN